VFVGFASAFNAGLAMNEHENQTVEICLIASAISFGLMLNSLNAVIKFLSFYSKFGFANEPLCELKRLIIIGW
tara:strand:+ start:659 stop:877 length:219 start_codon:yes stop_codon:yes gene_type:complete